jgi:hypothetical protein
MSFPIILERDCLRSSSDMPTEKSDWSSSAVKIDANLSFVLHKGWLVHHEAYKMPTPHNPSASVRLCSLFPVSNDDQKSDQLRVP